MSPQHRLRDTPRTAPTSLRFGNTDFKQRMAIPPFIFRPIARTGNLNLRYPSESLEPKREVARMIVAKDDSRSTHETEENTAHLRGGPGSGCDRRVHHRPRPIRIYQGAYGQGRASEPGLYRQRNGPDQTENLRQHWSHFVRPHYAPLRQGRRPRKEGAGAGHD